MVWIWLCLPQNGLELRYSRVDKLSSSQFCAAEKNVELKLSKNIVESFNQDMDFNYIVCIQMYTVYFMYVCDLGNTAFAQVPLQPVSLGKPGQ